MGRVIIDSLHRLGFVRPLLDGFGETRSNYTMPLTLTGAVYYTRATIDIARFCQQVSD